jgi:nucleoside-diphosphate-sugar epimerase
MILVTGGAGYVGSVLVRNLLSLGHAVRVVDTFWFGNRVAPHDRLEMVTGDLRSLEQKWLDDVKAIIHLAGFSNDPTADFAPDLNNEHNVIATRQFAEAVAARAVREDQQIRFLFASTCSVYYASTTRGDVNTDQMTEDRPVAPTSHYSRAKRLAELDLLRIANRVSNFVPIIVRKGTIFGLSPRMRFDLVVNAFCLDAWCKRLLTVHGHGEMWRPLLHIQDAVDAYIYLLSAPLDVVHCEIFNLVHKNYRILELAHWVAEVLEQERGVSIQVKRDRSANRDGRSYYVSGDKIAKAIGLKPGRGTTEAVIGIWDALERGDFGAEPGSDSRFFNIRCLSEALDTKLTA